MPGTVLETVEIPVVDLNSPGAPAELLDAAAQHGFIYVKHENIGLEPEQVNTMFELVQQDDLKTMLYSV